MNYRMCSFLVFQFFVSTMLQGSTFYEPVNRAAIKRIIEQEIDHLFEPHKHPSHIKTYINQEKHAALDNLVNSAIYYQTNQSSAKKEAIRITRTWAIDFVVYWAEYLAWQKLKNPPVNPELLNMYDIVTTIKDVIRSQAHMHLQEYNRLTLVVQNIYYNVEILIDQEIQQALTHRCISSFLE